jgi:AcrR family transcriptional regulator
VRADAQKNYDHLLDVARDVVGEQGADASLRDIARRAGVVVGTLYRHFPTRESLLAALLHAGFDALTARAEELATTEPTGDALLTWVRECYEFTHTYRGVTELMVSAIEDHESALHASCVRLRAAGTSLLERAQHDHAARDDVDGQDMFALIAALAWLADQPAMAQRSEHIFDVVVSTLFAAPAHADDPATGNLVKGRAPA